MVITAVLLQRRGDRALGLAAGRRLAVTGIFLTIDLAFFGANVLKITHGGWLPLVIGGRALHPDDDVEDGTPARGRPPDGAGRADRGFPGTVAATQPARVPGTAVFMTAQPRGTPPALAHNLRHNKVLHEHVVTLMVTTQPVPHVPPDEQVSVRPLGHGIFDVTVRYGFMEDPNVPEALRSLASRGSNWTRATSPISWAAKRSSSRQHPAWPCGGSSCSS